MAKKVNKQNKRKEEEEVLYIRENHEVLRETDFWKIHQIMREDFYFINNLKESLSNSILVLKKPKESMKLTYDLDLDVNQEINRFLKDIEEISKEFEKLDDPENIDKLQKKSNIDSEIHKEVAVGLDQELKVLNLNNYTNIIPFLDNFVLCIKLSEKIESKINEILQFLYKLNSMNNEIASIRNADLSIEFTTRKRAQIFEYGLDSSVENDKIINYEIMCIDKNAITVLSKKYELEKTNESVILQKKDLRYVNSNLKKRTFIEYRETGEIIKKSRELEKVKQMKILNRILFYFSSSSIGFQLLNLAGNYSTFYEKLRPYFSAITIKGLAMLIFLFCFILIIIVEVNIFSQLREDRKNLKEKIKSN